MASDLAAVKQHLWSEIDRRRDEVARLCESIARDLRNQYMLVYAPVEQPEDASFHKVQVTVKDPKHRRLTVRTRTGYYGPAAERGLLEKIQ